MSTSLSIKGKTTGGDGVTSTINYVNPNATDEQLTSLATAFNDLTTNTVSDITRIDKNSLTATKLDRNLRLTKSTGGTEETVTTIPFANLPDENNIGQSDLTIKGEGTFTAADLIVTKNTEGAAYIFTDWYNGETSGDVKFSIHKYQDDESLVTTGTITISLPATDIYKASSVTLTIT